ncbi:hypothetical protein ACIQV1_29630 [Streptomyces rubiginosohelvolus]|uniref:hypothetical protein n=1 Tax=Streptomyces rubiginosohelvolus TaxID=67362 RepID=UPI00380E84A3
MEVTVMDKALMPVLGNLAWVPHAAIERVEILDRFNGVPTLGVLEQPDANHLFWRVLGYVPERFSIWIYAPIDEAEVAHLEECESDELLEGLVFDCDRPRYITVGLAENNRLFFEREWRMPAGHSAEAMRLDLLGFLLDALTIAQAEGLPASRRDAVSRATQAVREMTLTACG